MNPDWAILHWIQNTLLCPFMDLLMPKISLLGNGGAVWILAAGHGDHVGRSLPQLCGDQPHATFTLRQTKSALHFHALALIPIVLSFVSGFTLLGPPQSWAGKTDPSALQ